MNLSSVEHPSVVAYRYASHQVPILESDFPLLSIVKVSKGYTEWSSKMLCMQVNVLLLKAMSESPLAGT